MSKKHNSQRFMTQSDINLFKRALVAEQNSGALNGEFKHLNGDKTYSTFKVFNKALEMEQNGEVLDGNLRYLNNNKGYDAFKKLQKVVIEPIVTRDGLVSFLNRKLSGSNSLEPSSISYGEEVEYDALVQYDVGNKVWNFGVDLDDSNPANIRLKVEYQLLDSPRPDFSDGKAKFKAQKFGSSKLTDIINSFN